MKRVGHKGAHTIVAGNTIASFRAALDVGVDMIEFDVLPNRKTGELIIAHDYMEASEIEQLPLSKCLAFFRDEVAPEVELDVDLKLHGYEIEVVDALKQYGLAERTIISSTFRSSLAKIRAYDSSIKLGWSVPRASRDYTKSMFLAIPVMVGLHALRVLLPGLAVKHMRHGGCDAVMVYWRAVSPKLVRRVKECGGEIYVWTVDHPEKIGKFYEMGVDGVITNDPRMFTELLGSEQSR